LHRYTRFGKKFKGSRLRVIAYRNEALLFVYIFLSAVRLNQILFFLVLLVRRVASSLDEREQYTFFNTRRALASSEGHAGVMSAAQLIDTLPHTLMDGIGG
jgi:hypothetical protein